MRVFRPANPKVDRIAVIGLWLIGSCTVGGMMLLYVARVRGESGVVARMVRDGRGGADESMSMRSKMMGSSNNAGQEESNKAA